MTSSASELQGTQVFTGRAGQYSAYRPSYPPGAVNWIFSQIHEVKPVLADIGSGTGRLTALLLDRADRVFAVEPNNDMRQEAERLLGGCHNFSSIPASARNTLLISASIDCITVAEAYHWFDSEETRAEFRRILKPGGSVVLLWNEFGPDPYGEEITRIVTKYRNSPLPPAGISRDERAARLFGEANCVKASFDNSFSQTFERFLGGHSSASYAPSAGTAAYEQFSRELESVFGRYSEGGLIRSTVTTVCYGGRP